MRSPRFIRTIAVVGMSALVLGAFAAAPADAAKKKKKACPAYTASGDAASAPTTVVTPAATEEKPVEVAIEAPAGVPEVGTAHVFQNVQIHAPAGGGLFVRYEFPTMEDYDLYLRDGAGEELARAAGFNPISAGPFDGTGAGGHSEQGAEQIDGFPVANCDGYTVDMLSYMGEGGELTLKLWLGEAAAAE